MAPPPDFNDYTIIGPPSADKSGGGVDSVIEVQDLSVSYGGRRVVERLSFQVRRGEVFGFLGPNGAGKTTTIKALLGLVFPSSGKALLHGLPSMSPASRVKIGFMPEEATYYRFLTPVELLTFYGEIFGVPRVELARRVDALLDLVGLTSVRNKPLSAFSKGMVQKVSLAQALVNDPETLILDEPTTGLDPLAKNQLRHILSGLREKGKTVFFSSHELSEVELISDSVLILKAGRVLRSGPLREMLQGRGDRSLEKYFLETVEGVR